MPRRGLDPAAVVGTWRRRSPTATGLRRGRRSRASPPRLACGRRRGQPRRRARGRGGSRAARVSATAAPVMTGVEVADTEQRDPARRVPRVRPRGCRSTAAGRRLGGDARDGHRGEPLGVCDGRGRLRPPRPGRGRAAPVTPPWRSPRPSRRPGLDDLAVAGRQPRRVERAQRAGGLRAPSAGARSRAGQREAPVRLRRVATPPRVEYVSPQNSVRSRVSRKATWPGVWPGSATTSSEPTRSPGSSVRVGASWRPGSRRGTWRRRARPARASCPCRAGARRARRSAPRPRAAPAARASSEPMWSAWAWVRTIRTIGRPSLAAAARIACGGAWEVVSISVIPSSSSTRYALTKPKRAIW